MFHSLMLTIILLAASVYAQVHRRQDNDSSTPVTGVQSGSFGQRQEIHTLQADTDAWNIYLLALAKMQQTPATDLSSWYSIASIHGAPYTPWNNVEPCSNCTLAGYCTHMSTLFPTWHRAYLGLFEQSLVRAAMLVAADFPTVEAQERYYLKAQQLRMPYWDWAQPSPPGEDPFPQIFEADRISVSAPQGNGTIPNPLKQYKFQPGEDGNFMLAAPKLNANYTIRDPTFTVDSRQQLRTDLWTLLTSQRNYNAFSTQALMPDASNFNSFSIEALHDTVHTQVGGTMAYIPFSAYDPIFWLHHANVDHAFALWQAQNPDTWLEPWSEVGSSMTYASGTVEGSQSPLTPFHDSDSGFWDSDAVRTTHALNYEYADLTSGASAASVINTLYGGSGTTVVRTKRSIDFSGSKISDYINQVMSQVGGLKTEEYMANVQVDSMSMNGSFTIFLFDGDFNEANPSGWYSEPNLIGSHGFFSSLHPMGSGSVRVNAGITLTNSLLTSVAAGIVDALTNGAVTRYLKDHLQWRILTIDGTVMDDTDVPGLVVAIVTSEVQLSDSQDNLPIWGAFRTLEEITKDRACGYGDAGNA